MLGDKVEGLLFRLCQSDDGFLNGLGQSGSAVVLLVPIIHGLQNGVGLVDHQGGSLGDEVQVFVRDQSRDLKNDAGFWVQS